MDVVDLLSVLSIVSLSLDSCSLALLSLALDSLSLRSSFIAFLSTIGSHFCLTKHSHVPRGIIASLAAELDVSDNVSKVVVQAIHSHLIRTALLEAHTLFAERTGSTFD